MQAASQFDETLTRPRTPVFRRVWMALGLLVLLLMLALLPPYLNVNRYQRRITQSISASLGRPVHLDHVTLNLLPTPGFTLDRFVVSEDPSFGSEPTIRAESVRATLRISTLWRRRIEFATISLTDPSVNLVHLADGRWNVDSILLQTARLASAPTEQRTAGTAARFPYIEATGARVNLKMDQEKTPVALTEADFAMWLPRPERWNFRVKARPTRTDVPVGYTGLLRLEGTLGRAPTLGEIPIDLKGEWRGVPLGEMSRILLGRDGGWRGDVTVTATAQGTVGTNRAETHLHLADGRRADFVPQHLLSVTAVCAATVTSAFHGLTDAVCRTPEDGAGPAVVTVGGSLEDIRRPGSASGRLQVGPAPAELLVGLLHTLSERIPEGLALGGTVAAQGTYDQERQAGSATLKGGTVNLGTGDPIAIGPAMVQMGEPETPEIKPGNRRKTRPVPTNAGAMILLPTTLGLGGREPAVLEGRFDRQGYTLHLTGGAMAERLRALSAAVPQFGDGLLAALPEAVSPAAPLRLDLVATRTWGSPQVWQAAARQVAPTKVRRRRNAR